MIVERQHDFIIIVFYADAIATAISNFDALVVLDEIRMELDMGSNLGAGWR